MTCPMCGGPTCPVCGSPVLPPRRTYCSESHRHIGYRLLNREALLASARERGKRRSPRVETEAQRERRNERRRVRHEADPEYAARVRERARRWAAHHKDRLAAAKRLRYWGEDPVLAETAAMVTQLKKEIRRV
jgi:hypothetical protein